MLVLVVDDTPADRKLLRHYFTRYGWQVEEAADGEEGMKAALRTLPDLIVADGLMPGVDGFELLRMVRGSKLAETPFIVYTSTYLHEKDREFSLQAGADAFLVKPLSPEEFIAEVRRVLERRAAGKKPPVRPADDAYLREYRELLIRKVRGKVE